MPYKPAPSEPIAVVASSCRFTGGTTSPSKLWDLLKEPTDLTRRVPPNRFNIKAFSHPEGDYHGTTDAPNSYFLDDEQDPRAFDSGFFGIAPKEAEAVDPQQRLLLETVYEALEASGYKLPDWTGKDVAVYVGAMTSDFDSMSQRDDLTTSPYYATGNARSILSNRISYFFDFHGPSATIDTACSSSLVALHQAVLSLRAGECSAACVAGVNLMLAPEQFVVESSLHMLSPAGHCHMWDTRADGYARGEGAAVLLLKPLSRALADGDASRIQGIIRETGVGSDGRTSGITMPSPDAQASLIRSTYQRAGLDIADPADRCQYFEAHGTGTPVGDPREAQAIHSAFFGHAVSNTPDVQAKAQDKLLVGSVKTVIGHTEGAAGLAGILKVMLAMKNAQVPPNLHMLQLSPTVAPFCTPSPSHSGHLEVASKLQTWPQLYECQPMRASVNSFGFGGTNAHAIMEHFDESIHTPNQASLLPSAAAPALKPHATLPHIPLFISATSSSSLRALAQRYLDYLQTLQDGSLDGKPSFHDIAWRALSARTLFIQRLSISANDQSSAIDALSRHLKSADSSSGSEFGVRARRIDKSLKLVGIFTGQGAQWAGMSKQLLSTSRIYREAIQSLDEFLQSCPHPPAWSVATELARLDSDSRVKEAAISQPLCTALQVGLVTLLKHLGIKFVCVVGHSSGEIGAAFAAGRISAKDAILIAYYRGLSVSHPHMQSLRGGMLAAGLSYGDAIEFCKQFHGQIGVAASNSPSSTTLSGDVDAIEAAEARLKSDNVFARRLAVDKAYHSHHMANFSEIYNEYLAACQISPLHSSSSSSEESAQPVWISSVYPGGDAPTNEQLASRYWVDNMTKPVLFHEAVERALDMAQLEDGIDGAIEVGPHSTLKGPFLDTYADARTSPSASTAKSTTPIYTSLIRRGQQDSIVLQDFVGFMSTHFDPSPIKIEGLLMPDERDCLEASLAKVHGDEAEKLPGYVWDHSQIYYRQSRIVRQFHYQTEAPHELLGTRTRDDVNGCELRWRNLLRVDKLPWLAHHAFQGQPLFPASAYCIMALEAAKALLAGRPASLIQIEDIEFVGGTPLEIDGPATEIMFSLMVQDPSKMAAPTPPNNDKTIQAVFSIYAAPEASDAPMRKRCSGRICVVLGEPDKDALPSRMDPDVQPDTFPVPIDAFYDMMQSVGLSYSGPFQAIESLHRCHDFASASMKRFHTEDTTGLAISPATLDSCLQACFATFSSPGDKALWTAFLPIHMKKISFNMAHKGVAGAAGPKRTPKSESLIDGSNYHIDAELTHFQEATVDSPSRITGDILIYNDDGDMEVGVEALTVGSFASSDPSTDRELYLHTTYAADPEHSLVMGSVTPSMEDDNGIDEFYNANYGVLEESCERVAAFGRPGSAWPTETSESLQQHILASPYSLTLEKIQNIAPVYAMDQKYQTTLEEGRHAGQFQRQLSKIVKQIGHRYPRMSVVSLTDAEMRLSLPIARGLGSAFTRYTSMMVGLDPGFTSHLEKQPEYLQLKMHSVSLDTAHDIKNTLVSSTSVSENTPLDLVIVSTSIFKQLESSEAVLSQVKELMRPGGFLLLVHMPLVAAGKSNKSTVKGASDISVEDEQFSVSRNGDAMITPPDWPDILEQSGFMKPTIENTDQHYPGGFSITVRQCDSPFKKSLYQAGQNDTTLDEKLLIIGGATAGTVSLASATSHLLFSHFSRDCTVIYGLDGLAELPPAILASFTSAIVLADLDDYQPVLSTLDEQRLDDLRSLLLVPGLTVLWVTKGARNGNAECAASYGFTRSIRAEMPSLTLQMLDFDHLHMVNGQLRAPAPKNVHSTHGGSSPIAQALAASVIADQFIQLVMGKGEKERTQQDTSESPSHLWDLETEIFIGQDGQRLIPRMVPFAPGNDNFNASRRVVAKSVNTLSACLEVIKHANGSRSANATSMGPSIKSLIESSQLDIDLAVVKTFYSTPEHVYGGFYLCVGRDELSGQTVATMAKSCASYLAVPRSQTVPLGQSVPLSDKNPGAFASYLAKFLLFQSICRRLDKNNPLVFIAPDDLLLKCASSLAADSQHTVASIQVSQERTEQTGRNQSTVTIHPRSTPSQINSVLRRFGDGTAFVSFLPTDHFIAHHIEKNLADGCTYQSWAEVGEIIGAGNDDFPNFDSEEASSVLKMAVASASQHLEHIFKTTTNPELVPLPVLLKGTGNSVSSPLIIDWRADRAVPHIERPLENLGGRRTTEVGSEVKLRANRTYVLVGITRDMGQSLAALFVRQGARHIVLASRTAVAKQPQWARKLTSVYGAAVRFLPLDVTDLAAVRHFRVSIEKDMPLVGGIVNGAMVLDDRVFTHMTADIFSRVMRPKTVGSRNLDTVFRDDGVDAGSKLDFFIMTSSFAGPGGHAGQSNYAAANMYMNGLAANRQRRGASGSVLNIGVIYGLGFLHREKGELYAGLEREGYPPISERDLHHMFLEAIRQGRPKTLAADRARPIVDLTTGLSRYDPNQSADNALHWHSDPRFSHFTVRATSSTVSGANCKGADDSSVKILTDMISQATAPADAIGQQIVAAFVERLSTLLHLDSSSVIRGDNSLAELGVDSLVAVETRTWLYRTTGQDVPVMRILGSPSINKLCMDIGGAIVAGRKDKK